MVIMAKREDGAVNGRSRARRWSLSFQWSVLEAFLANFSALFETFYSFQMFSYRYFRSRTV